MDDELQELRTRIEDAEQILVGLGESFQYDWNALLRNDRYREIEQEIGNKEQHVWIVPFLQRMMLQKREERWEKAYRILGNLLKDKNYFIVSL